MAKSKPIGAVLREARLEAGLSTRDLERLTGVANGAISQLESGARRSPAFATVLTLAKALGISMDEIAARVEGRVGKAGGSDAAVPRALNALAKAEADHARLAKALATAKDALSVKRSK